ncbi:MAG TPA: acetyl-CoA carboxylase biotin carboxyl carrier protein [Spirochaetota bacterium]|nr:acetyl-CoA carboxylase biotin carboxyl carrier protein [Spirochaetota bacterium]HOL56086.1 acetyl-CoA carboxylase biotin carboxyl carrier protein [Spirochaetota bacterium]HPP03500.1 acetyl-CoA carboxylase biotin carboxyl carrier protein [Spirochaetota bacterium]
MKEIDLTKIFDSMKANDISELIIKDGGKLYEIRRGGFKQVSQNVITQPVSTQIPVVTQPVSQQITSSQAIQTSGAETKAQENKQAESKNYYEVKSPLVGTFYASPKPDAPPFVEVGTKVTKGKKLCIVEAMKNFNEIESEVDGIVREICVKNGELVEFGKVLFRIELTS